jgi:hypothetical protein
MQNDKLFSLFVFAACKSRCYRPNSDIISLKDSAVSKCLSTLEFAEFSLLYITDERMSSRNSIMISDSNVDLIPTLAP